jgi:uncharacterized membrane protein YecN with MAPEG domain
MEITTIFLAILALMYLALSLRVSLVRTKTGVAIGNGKDEALIRAVRTHANFNEYTLLLIFIMWMLEYSAAAEWFLWLFGIGIVVGRVAHAYGMWDARTPDIARGAGMLVTYALLLVGSLYALLFALT